MSFIARILTQKVTTQISLLTMLKKLTESLSFQGCYYFQILFYVLEKLWTGKYAVVLHHQKLYSKHMNVKLMLIQLNEPNVLNTIWCGSRYKPSWWSIRRENLNNPIEEIIAISIAVNKSNSLVWKTSIHSIIDNPLTIYVGVVWQLLVKIGGAMMENCCKALFDWSS